MISESSLEQLIQPGQWWNMRLARAVLASEGAKSRRSLERLLRQQLAWPPALPVSAVTDHIGRAPNPLLLAQAAERARRKRRLLLVVQMALLPTGQPCLHAHDSRGARYWYPLRDNPPEASELQLAFESLAATHPRGVVPIPHGELVQWMQGRVGFGLHDHGSSAEIQLPPLGGSRAPHQPTAARQPDPVLRELENESLHMLREAVAGSKNPVLLFSAGKDSAVLLHLLRKAFFPMTPPLPMLHIDTRWKFQAMYRYRDQVARAADMNLVVYTHPQAIEENINPFDHGPTRHTEITKTVALRTALDQGHYDVIIAGARRDEEKSRAKERKFSVRAPGHRWDPRRQRPEPWRLYHTGLAADETLRVFPLSNWTELDVWRYIEQEGIPVVDLYFAADRPVVTREGQLIVVDDARFRLRPGEMIDYRRVRFRSLGCYPLTAAVDSEATTVRELIEELESTRQSERGGRIIDVDQPGSMELKKREGYF